jgi:hypothetical protein
MAYHIWNTAILHLYTLFLDVTFLLRPVSPLVGNKQG